MTRGNQLTIASSMGLEEIGHPGPGRYTELPVHGLADAFRCAWVRHVAGGMPAPPIRILPDNCADFIATDDGRTWLVGPATRVELSALPPGTVARGLRIQPQALGVVIDADPAELTDRHASFNEILPARVARTLADALLTGVLDDRLLRQLWPAVVLDHRVTRGIRMLASEPGLSVEAVARECAMSPRQFRRAVRQASGLAPKTLQRVSRMHRVLDIARLQPHASLAELSAAAGFADQAHLARDVRQLADLTPQHFLRQHG